MVFLIPNTQNRDGTAAQINLFRAIAQADEGIIDTDDATENELRVLKARYKLLAKQYHELKSKLESISAKGY